MLTATCCGPTERDANGNRGDDRTWYRVSGYSTAFGVRFDGDEYAICRDGSVLDRDGYPLTPGDRETECLARELRFRPTRRARPLSR